MCISMATAALVSAGAGAVGTIAQIDNNRRQRHQAADAARAAAETEARAAQGANNAMAARRKALRSNSLTTGGEGMASAQRQTLGGT